MDSIGNLQLTKVLVHILDWASNCFCIVKDIENCFFLRFAHSSVSPCRRRAATASQFALSLHGQNHDHLGSRGGLWGLGGAGQCRGVYTRSSGPNNNRWHPFLTSYSYLPSLWVLTARVPPWCSPSLPPPASVSSLPNTTASGIAVRDGEDVQSTTLCWDMPDLSSPSYHSRQNSSLTAPSPTHLTASREAGGGHAVNPGTLPAFLLLFFFKKKAFTFQTPTRFFHLLPSFPSLKQYPFLASSLVFPRSQQLPLCQNGAKFNTSVDGAQEVAHCLLLFIYLFIYFNVPQITQACPPVHAEVSHLPMTPREGWLARLCSFCTTFTLLWTPRSHLPWGPREITGSSSGETSDSLWQREIWLRPEAGANVSHPFTFA